MPAEKMAKNGKLFCNCYVPTGCRFFSPNLMQRICNLLAVFLQSKVATGLNVNWPHFNRRVLCEELSKVFEFDTKLDVLVYKTSDKTTIKLRPILKKSVSNKSSIKLYKNLVSL